MARSDDDLLSVNETTALLGISRTALYTIVDDRKELAVADVKHRGSQRLRLFRRRDVVALKLKREGIVEAQV